MDNFKKKLKNQQHILTTGLLFACVSLLSSRNFTDASLINEFQHGFIEGFQVGIVAALFGFLAFFFIRNLLAIRNPEKLKKLYVSETDERKLFIKQQSGSAGMNFIMYGLAIGTMVAGNFNGIAFYSLLGACLFVAIVRGFLKIYYKNKF